MCAADEVTLVDAMHGAGRGAGATAGALAIVDNGEVVDHLDRALGTGLLALAASNTAVLAALAYRRTLIVVRALNNNALGILDKMNDTVGTLSYAHTASDTLSRIDASNAILDSDSVLGTDSHAVTIAEAGVGAKLISRVVKVSNTTALNTVVDVSALGSGAVSVAGNVCHLLDNVLCLDAKNSGDILRALVSTGDTKVSLVTSALCESLCITVASRISAGTTVSTGETVADSEGALILFYSKENVCNGKECGANEADSGKE